MLEVGFSAPRILDFDIEARPLGWYGGDWVHKEPTAIASAWIEDGEPVDMKVDYLTTRKGSMERMLEAFLKRYDEADMVTGHYIRGFDLGVLNTALGEFGVGHLDPKQAHDTKLDLIKLSGISKSQENLASLLEIEKPKVGMTMNDWRLGNRLLPEGIKLVVERVTGDVSQHVHMRAALLEREWLKAPKMWDAGRQANVSVSYTP